ncbi:MAG: carbohydrate porin, partial [Rikenellaceae bacterium]
RHYLNSDKSKSLDAMWMVSMYEAFGSDGAMSFNKIEQFYIKANNLLGFGEYIWAGKRFYDRKSIYMLDRMWLNPGQNGWGAGVENLLNKGTDEDLKFAAWQLRNEDVVSYENGLVGDLYTYTADIRWVNKPITERANINFALNFSYRVANDELSYAGHDGYGAFVWIDYANPKKFITNTTAVLLRHGANITKHHWTGISISENPGNNTLITNNLNGSYSVELNNDFLYDNKDSFCVNVVTMLVASNYGTAPYSVNDGVRTYVAERGENFYWASTGVRSSYYVSQYFRPTFEYSYEYGHSEQLDTKGSLHRFTFTPELSLKKGYYSRPVLRPFASYALWDDGLKGYVGTTPKGAPYGDATQGFTYGVQFEIWW